MKTFAQAAEVVASCGNPVETGPPPSEVERLAGVAERYKSLIAEAIETEYFEALIAQCTETVLHLNLKSALATAFLNGLMVGIEMERQEIE